MWRPALIELGVIRQREEGWPRSISSGWHPLTDQAAPSPSPSCPFRNQPRRFTQYLDVRLACGVGAPQECAQASLCSCTFRPGKLAASTSCWWCSTVPVQTGKTVSRPHPRTAQGPLCQRGHLTPCARLSIPGRESTASEPVLSAPDPLHRAGGGAGHPPHTAALQTGARTGTGCATVLSRRFIT